MSQATIEAPKVERRPKHYWYYGNDAIFEEDAAGRFHICNSYGSRDADDLRVLHKVLGEILTYLASQKKSETGVDKNEAF